MTEDEVREALQQLDPLWDELFPAEQARIVQLLVERVDVGIDGVDLRLRVDGLTGLVREAHARSRKAGMIPTLTAAEDLLAFDRRPPLPHRPRRSAVAVPEPHRQGRARASAAAALRHDDARRDQGAAGRPRSSTSPRISTSGCRTR